MRPIHGCIPVILSPGEYASWLDQGMNLADLRAMLISRAGTDGPALIEAV